MLFLLGTIELETPMGRFILTADSVIRLPKRRRATKEEAARIWPALETQLMYASYGELLPWYELYWELTSERFHGPGSEPHVSNLLRTIEFALRSEQLHLEVQEPYDPLPELEWEPPPLKPMGPPALSPSELWGRREAKETFIGIRLKDQNGDPVSGSRVRFKLPDGKTKEGKTDSDGELQIAGFTLDGTADITLLDFAKAGAAKPIEPDAPKEFKIVVVDETGKNGVADVAMVFSDGATPETIKTDSSGTATFKTPTADVVSVNFESRDSLANAIKPMWKSRPPTKPEDYAKPGGDISAVELRPATIDVAESDGDLFKGVKLEPDAPQTISVRPPPKRALILEFHDALFRTASAVVMPEEEAPSTQTGEHEALTSVGLVATLLRYNEENPGKKLFIGGHTDRVGPDSLNKPLSEHRAQAVLALIEGERGDYIKACNSSHTEVDVTQLFDWTHNNPEFNFTCKPTTLTAAPSDANYVKFRSSFNEWVDAAEAGENRGTKINPHGRLSDDIWGAMFDLYEFNLKDELGEDPSSLRSDLKWVDDGKKFVGYGEKHPLEENCPDEMRSQQDRRVEVLLFDDDDEVLPKLAETDGEDVYDGMTYARVAVPPMKSAKRKDMARIRLHDAVGNPLPNVAYEVTTPGYQTGERTTDEEGWAYVAIGAVCPSDPIDVRWDKLDNGKFIYAQSVLLDCGAGASNDAGKLRLKNLAYDTGKLEAAVDQFQLNYGLTRTAPTNGQMDDETLKALQNIFEMDDCNATRKKQGTA